MCSVSLQSDAQLDKRIIFSFQDNHFGGLANYPKTSAIASVSGHSSLEGSINQSVTSDQEESLRKDRRKKDNHNISEYSFHLWIIGFFLFGGRVGFLSYLNKQYVITNKTSYHTKQNKLKKLAQNAIFIGRGHSKIFVCNGAKRLHFFTFHL